MVQSTLHGLNSACWAHYLGHGPMGMGRILNCDNQVNCDEMSQSKTSWINAPWKAER